MVKFYLALGVRNRKVYLAPGMRNGRIYLASNDSYEKFYLAVKGLILIRYHEYLYRLCFCNQKQNNYSSVALLILCEHKYHMPSRWLAALAWQLVIISYQLWAINNDNCIVLWLWTDYAINIVWADWAINSNTMLQLWAVRKDANSGEKCQCHRTL